MYAVHPTCISEIHSIHQKAPPFRTFARSFASITFVLHHNHETLPTFFFVGGGTREMLGALASVARLTQSAEDPTILLVNDLADPLSRSLVGLDLALTGALPPMAHHHSQQQHQRRSVSSPVQRGGGGGGNDDLPIVQGFTAFLGAAAAAATDIINDIDNMFVSKAEAGANATEEVVAAAEGEREEDAEARLRATSSASAAEHGDLGSFVILKDAPPSGDGGTRARMVHQLAMVHEEPPVTARELSTFLDEEGRMCTPSAVLRRVFRGGLESSTPSTSAPELAPPSALQRDVWALLLGLYGDPQATPAERAETLKAKRRRYAELRMQWSSIDETQARRFSKFRERRQQIDKDVPRTDSAHPYFNGYVVDEAEVAALVARNRRASSGASRASRSSSIEGGGAEAEPIVDEDAAPGVGSYSHELKAHRLDMLRGLLLTYGMYHFDLGYCQGMSDVASLLLSVMDNEADAFWCFVQVMDVHGFADNFLSDENGMARQLASVRDLLALADAELMAHLESIEADNLFFLYRWVLLRFKRELLLEEATRLWEVLFCSHESLEGLDVGTFHLYLAAALVTIHRDALLRAESLDDCLRWANSLKECLPLAEGLRRAESLVMELGTKGREAVAPCVADVDGGGGGGGGGVDH